MRLKTPNYSKRSPVVNDMHFTDARIGSTQASFNPGSKAAAFPNGPPKYVQVPGKRPFSKGLTNKRFTTNI